jgi:hypothetical protein
MKPHHEFSRLLIVNDLRSFEDAATDDVAGRVFRNLQSDSLVLPVDQIPGRVAMYADLRTVPRLALGHVLAEPVIRSGMEQDSSSMRIDGNTVAVIPNFSGPKRVVPVGLIGTGDTSQADQA